MVARVLTAALTGLDAHKVTAEVDMNNSLPAIIIVGLPDTAVSEAKERVRSAIKNTGFQLPAKKITINLAPADIKKEGSMYDLPLAMGILAACGELDDKEFKDTAFIGELSLDGSVRAVRGVLPIVSGLKDLGITKIVVPLENAKEAALVPGVTVWGAKDLVSAVNHFITDTEQRQSLPEIKVNLTEYMAKAMKETPDTFDFKDVKGQIKAKKALETAAAGAHNVLMSGSPGSGKTLLAKCFASILPPPEPEEAVELTKIYSTAGLLDTKKPLIVKRPFRTVHHTASAAGITGGGSNPKPGEITLAHRGILFLDEIVEFPRQILETLRQPLEDGEIVISRAQMSVKYPAKFILVGTMNPCPCGYLGDKERKCTCTEYQIQRYRAGLSGPLTDRIDIQIEVPRLKPEELIGAKFESESSASIRERVKKARKIQAERYKGYGFYTNSELNAKTIKIFCKLNAECEDLLKAASKKFALTGRSYDRTLKLSRTIADLDGSENIETAHIAQALQYRTLIEPSA